MPPAGWTLTTASGKACLQKRFLFPPNCPTFLQPGKGNPPLGHIVFGLCSNTVCKYSKGVSIYDPPFTRHHRRQVRLVYYDFRLSCKHSTVYPLTFYAKIPQRNTLLGQKKSKNRASLHSQDISLHSPVPKAGQLGTCFM